MNQVQRMTLFIAAFILGLVLTIVYLANSSTYEMFENGVEVSGRVDRVVSQRIYVNFTSKQGSNISEIAAEYPQSDDVSKYTQGTQVSVLHVGDNPQRYILKEALSSLKPSFYFLVFSFAFFALSGFFLINFIRNPEKEVLSQPDMAMLIRHSIKKTRTASLVFLLSLLFLNGIFFGIFFLGWDAQFPSEPFWKKSVYAIIFMGLLFLLFLAAKFFLGNLIPEKSLLWKVLYEEGDRLAWYYVYNLKGRYSRVTQKSVYFFLTDGTRLNMMIPFEFEKLILLELSRCVPNAVAGFSPEYESLFRKDPKNFIFAVRSLPKFRKSEFG